MRRRRFLGFLGVAPFVLLTDRSARADEISAVLEVRREDLSVERLIRWISGDGHRHRVVVGAEELARLWELGEVRVLADPGGPDGHTHTVRVTIRG